MIDKLLFVGNEGLGALERLVHFTGEDVIADSHDVWPGARRSLHQVSHQDEICFVMQARIASRVHQLDNEIDALCRRVGLLRRHDVFFAQDRRAAFDEQPCALTAIGYKAIAKNEALTGFELDLETHLMPLPAAACRILLANALASPPNVIGTTAARSDRPGLSMTGLSSTVVAAFARPADLHLLRCCRRA